MYQLSGEVLNQLLQYLASRPYSEVYQLVTLLQGATKLEEVDGSSYLVSIKDQLLERGEEKCQVKK